jgi:murein DD-endopeptidase MepM/ murein hydrolase activator NlpD
LQLAPSGKANSRTHSSPYVALLLAGLIVSLAPAPAQAAAQAGSPAYGGTQTIQRPVITGVSCLSKCGTTARRSLRAVAVQADGKLKIRGRNMSGTRTVIFTGAYGSRDDVRINPEAVGRLSVDVTVPGRARTGRLVLLAASYSPPSSQPVIVVPKEREDDDDGDDDDGGDHDHGDGSGVKDGTGPVSGQRLSWPVPRAPIYGVFGENRGSHRHAGIDISGPVGTPVRAAAGGKVIMSAPNGAYGNFICLAHSSISTCYAHLSDLLVPVGTAISQGQMIGHIGMTGNSSGAHLHFEVRSGTQPWAAPVDPLRFLSGGAALVRSGSHDHSASPRTLRRLPAAWGP